MGSLGDGEPRTGRRKELAFVLMQNKDYELLEDHHIFILYFHMPKNCMVKVIMKSYAAVMIITY